MNVIRNSRGFTLIELMIVVAIVSILAMIAYPSYVEQVRKSRCADASGALLGLANALQRHQTDGGTYAGAATGQVPDIYATQSPVDGGTAYYNLRIISADATTFTVNAVPTTNGGQNEYKCGTLTLTNTGAKGVSGGTATVDECWR